MGYNGIVCAQVGLSFGTSTNGFQRNERVTYFSRLLVTALSYCEAMGNISYSCWAVIVRTLYCGTACLFKNTIICCCRCFEMRWISWVLARCQRNAQSQSPTLINLTSVTDVSLARHPMTIRSYTHNTTVQSTQYGLNKRLITDIL